MMALPGRVTITLTVWPRWVDGATEAIKPMRRVLRFCSWRERSISTAIATGNILREPTIIRVFDETSGLTYLPLHEWLARPESALDGYWTVEPSQSAGTLIAPFESAVELAAGTAAQVTTQENNFIRNTPGVRRVVDLNNNAIAARMMGPHMAMSAR